MTIVVDTSVVLKWFHEEGESEVMAARALLDTHRTGGERLLVLNLCAYELGNVLGGSLRRPAVDIQAHVSLLLRPVGPLVCPRPSWYDAAAVLLERHRLTYYDACWAAAAEALDVRLVSADRQLLAAGLAVTATEAVESQRRG